MAKKTTRKRGAQPRNQNAFKHGFYSNTFQSGELGDLDAYMAKGIDEEIIMLRIVARRVMALANGVKDLEESITLLGALGLASARLAGMLKVKAIVGDDSGDAKQAISNALSDVLKEWGRI